MAENSSPPDAIAVERVDQRCTEPISQSSLSTKIGAVSGNTMNASRIGAGAGSSPETTDHPRSDCSYRVLVTLERLRGWSGSRPLATARW